LHQEKDDEENLKKRTQQFAKSKTLASRLAQIQRPIVETPKLANPNPRRRVL
jgi:hypothetical protein